MIFWEEQTRNRKRHRRRWGLPNIACDFASVLSNESAFRAPLGGGAKVVLALGTERRRLFSGFSNCSNQRPDRQCAEQQYEYPIREDESSRQRWRLPGGCITVECEAEQCCGDWKIVLTRAHHLASPIGVEGSTPRTFPRHRDLTHARFKIEYDGIGPIRMPSPTSDLILNDKAPDPEDKQNKRDGSRCEATRSISH